MLTRFPSPENVSIPIKSAKLMYIVQIIRCMDEYIELQKRRYGGVNVLNFSPFTKIFSQDANYAVSGFCNSVFARHD